jgi:SWI/SNF-related matrix-associated actin-dependent regulator of chromatin subfamily A-like protein 1
MILRDYQAKGAAFLASRDRALLGDQMGLGKTAQAIIAFSSIQPRGGRVLIVCPASLRLNWAAEIKMWAPGVTVQIATNFVSMSVDVVIVSYNLLQRLYSKLRPEMWGVVIADECHYLQSLDSQRTIHLRGGWGKSPIRCLRKWGLSGTPLQNRPINLYPILKWLEAPFAEKEFFFGMRYCGGEKENFRGATNIAELNEKLKTIMLRRTKEEVLGELPPKIRQVIELQATEEDYVMIGEESEILSDAGYSYEQVIQQLKRPDFNIFAMDKGVIARLRRNTGMAKIKAATDFIRDALESNEKIVVFAHHRDVLDGIATQFEETSYVMFHGGMNAKDKNDSVEWFQKWPKCRLFFGNIEAAGVGITLTAASLVIFVEQDWTPGKNEQALDRCHRIGQKDVVIGQFLVLNGSLDAHIARRNVEKQRVLDEVLT